MRTLSLIALLFLSFGAQAADGWGYHPDVYYDEMEQQSSVFTGYLTDNGTWMITFACDKQDSGVSSITLNIADMTKKSYFSMGDTVILKVDDNAPMKVAFAGYRNLLMLKNPKYEIIRQFKAGNTLKIRVPGTLRTLEIPLAGFTKGIGPVLDLYE